MKGYNKEDKKNLAKKYNLKGFEGFSLKDKIALCEWQVEVLDQNSEHKKVRDNYKKWETELIKLRKQELIEESEELLTSKGRVKGIVTEYNTFRKLCSKCNSTGINITRNSNICSDCCGKGYYIINKPREYTVDKYKEMAIKKADKNLKKKALLTRIPIEEMELHEIEKIAFGG